MMKSLIAAAVPLMALACDLRPDERALRRSFAIDVLNSDSDPCMEKENCFSGPGTRTVLRFDSKLRNVGDEDCTIGWTPDCPKVLEDEQPLQFPFQYDTCHKHWHFTGLAEYFLYDMDGNMVANGAKNGLCLMDHQDCPRGRFDCENQGISAGCWDTYEKDLDCQWIDVTGLPHNKWYEFVWVVNAGRTIREVDYSNNVARVRVKLSRVPKESPGRGQVVNQCRVSATTGEAFAFTECDPETDPTAYLCR